ncbi:MAG: lytic transglycosylase domain-containing protein, partial [Myxococcota bacterium]|nr:lytic transglycosylase domain-containing protein [Myxococcota bacterium]
CKGQSDPTKPKVKHPTVIRNESKNPSTVRQPKSKVKGATSGGRETGNLQDRMDLYEPSVEEASNTYEIPKTFIRAVIRVESSFHYKAESGAGAQGLMQLMPGTARSMGVNDSFDPRQNVMGGTRFLRVLANKYDGDMVKVLAAYNAGAGAVKKKGGIPYEGTEGYVRAVLDHYYRYKALSGED